MTNQEMTDALAKVMGWHKWIPPLTMDQDDTWPSTWLDVDGLTMAFLCNDDAKLPMAMECAPKLGDGLEGVFDPLHNHNHMAMVIHKFLEIIGKGDWLDTHQYVDRVTCQVWIHPHHQDILVTRQGSENILFAQAQAIIEAIERGKSKPPTPYVGYLVGVSHGKTHRI